MANKLHAHGKVFKLLQNGKVTGFTFSQKRRGRREFDHRAILFTSVPVPIQDAFAAHNATENFRFKRARTFANPATVAERAEGLMGAVGDLGGWTTNVGGLGGAGLGGVNVLLGFGLGALAKTAGDVSSVIAAAREDLPTVTQSQTWLASMNVPDGATRACLDPGTGRVKFGGAGSGTWSVTNVGPMVPSARGPESVDTNKGARLDPSTLYLELYDLTAENPGETDGQASDVERDGNVDADAGIALVCVYGLGEIA
jgi:hypothetical protein